MLRIRPYSWRLSAKSVYYGANQPGLANRSIQSIGGLPASSWA
jgi:hypothetical protein